MFSLNVANFGVGPAKVESLEVFCKGGAVRNARELAELCCLQSTVPTREQTLETSIVMGTVLRASEVRHIIEIPEDTHNSSLTARLHDALGSIVMRACYCSVFDECWLTDLRTLHPPRVRECPVSAVPSRG